MFVWCWGVRCRCSTSSMHRIQAYGAFRTPHLLTDCSISRGILCHARASRAGRINPMCLGRTSSHAQDTESAYSSHHTIGTAGGKSSWCSCFNAREVHGNPAAPASCLLTLSKIVDHQPHLVELKLTLHPVSKQCAVC